MSDLHVRALAATDLAALLPVIRTFHASRIVAPPSKRRTGTMTSSGAPSTVSRAGSKVRLFWAVVSAWPALKDGVVSMSSA